MSDGAGKAGHAFLERITGELWLFAAMMSDAAAETMNLIRFLDDENLSTVDLCERVEHYLAHITWMFFNRGVFTINGHVAFIVRWYEEAPHHFVAGNAGRCIGGIPFSKATLDKCLDHMQSWVVLARHTLEAEFPSIDIINSFSVFKLPRDPQVVKASTLKTPAVDKKLRRLATFYKVPQFPDQFRSIWARAAKCYMNSNYMLSHWLSWRGGIKLTSAPSGDLLVVIKRGETWAPVTSGVEQSFAKIHERLGENRLNASPHVEDRSINLIMASLNAAQLDRLVECAIAVWRKCFQKHSRVKTKERSNKNVMLGCASRANPNSERSFLKRIHEDITANAALNVQNAVSVLDGSKPSSWSAGHDAELRFQESKHHKKMVCAALHGSLLPEEHTDALRQASHAEAARRTVSYRDRTGVRQKFANRTIAVPPSLAELVGQVYLDNGLMWKPEWLLRLGVLGASIASDVHVASVFVAKVPRSPCSSLVNLCAVMRGTWIISPEVLLGRPGPSVKYKSALVTKRVLWSTPAFRQNFRAEWLLILEVLSANSNRWTVLGSAHEWALARNIAEDKKRPAEVITLIGPGEGDPQLKHMFLPADCVAFLANTDPLKGSIGLLDM